MVRDITSVSVASSRPDTVYISFFMNWELGALRDLERIRLQLSKGHDARLEMFMALQAESDVFRSLSVDDALRVVDERLSCQDPLLSSLGDAVTSQVFVWQEKSWKVSGWSPRVGFHLMLEDDQFRIHVRLHQSDGKSSNCALEIGQKAFWSAENWRFLLNVGKLHVHKLGRPLRSECISRLDAAIHTQAFSTADLVHDKFACRALNRALFEKRSFLDKIRLAFEDGTLISLLDQLEKNTDRVSWFKGYEPQMISWGQRGTSALHARLYNKTRQIAHSPEKKSLFREVWAQLGFDPSKPVFNLEFEACRDCLRNVIFTRNGEAKAMNTIQDLIDNYDLFVQYCVGSEDSNGWMRMIEPGSATRLSSDN